MSGTKMVKIKTSRMLRDTTSTVGQHLDAVTRAREIYLQQIKRAEADYFERIERATLALTGGNDDTDDDLPPVYAASAAAQEDDDSLPNG